MKFLSQVILFLVYVGLNVSIYASQSRPVLTLGQLMEAIPEIRDCTPQVTAHNKLVGKKFTINGQTYEWHYFAFADPNKDLPSKITFTDYVSNHSLHSMKSFTFQPVEGLVFDCFDATHAQTGDQAYFNIVIRRVEDRP